MVKLDRIIEAEHGDRRVRQCEHRRDESRVSNVHGQ